MLPGRVKLLIARIIKWATDYVQTREANKVAKLYSASFGTVLADTHNPSSKWYDDYRYIEVPSIGEPVDVHLDLPRAKPTRYRYTACAVSSRRHPGRISRHEDVMMSCQL